MGHGKKNTVMKNIAKDWVVTPVHGAVTAISSAAEYVSKYLGQGDGVQQQIVAGDEVHEHIVEGDGVLEHIVEGDEDHEHIVEGDDDQVQFHEDGEVQDRLSVDDNLQSAPDLTVNPMSITRVIDEEQSLEAEAMKNPDWLVYRKSKLFFDKKNTCWAAESLYWTNEV